MRTALCDLLGIEVPIIQAPIQSPVGGESGPRLAAAVCNAGGLGTMPLFRTDAAHLREHVRELKALTDRPFAVNLNLAVADEGRLEACLEESVPIVSFFWGDPAGLIPIAKAGGALVMLTVGSVEQALAGVAQGVDVVVAQGWEPEATCAEPLQRWRWYRRSSTASRRCRS